MTLAEFKAWFEGFAENIDGAPTPEQWARVAEKLDEVCETAPPIWINPYPVPWTFTHDPAPEPWTITTPTTGGTGIKPWGSFPSTSGSYVLGSGVIPPDSPH